MDISHSNNFPVYDNSVVVTVKALMLPGYKMVTATIDKFHATKLIY
jgi:hypothetical protein